jgi:hypothetical protein
MNERIRELIEQCTDRHFNEGGGFETFDKEKFAELIVRECALTLYKSAVQDKQAGFAHEAKIMELAGDMIKQHFGVEE